MPQMDTVMFAIDVVAGVLPGQPEPEFTGRWVVTSTEWGDAGATPDGQSRLLAETAGKANGYAQLLMLLPDRLNWVKTEWVWF